MSDPIRLSGTAGPPAAPHPAPADAPVQDDLSPAGHQRLLRLQQTAADTVRLVNQSGTSGAPCVSLEAAGSPGRRLASGVWYADDRRTGDGAPVRVVTVHVGRARLGPLFGDGLRGMAPQEVQRHPQFVAAVNGTFFGAGVIGDLRGFGRTYADERAPLGAQARAADMASDRRYYLGVLKGGQVVTGRGGLSESGLDERLDSFQGGLGALYTRDQAAGLEADIRSGAFAARLLFPRDQQEQSIARSFLGVTADGKVLLVTMGSGERRRDGAGFTEAARIMRALGAAEAYILDGGGSTSLLVRGVTDTRTDGRLVKNYLAVFARP